MNQDVNRRVSVILDTRRRSTGYSNYCFTVEETQCNTSWINTNIKSV